MKYWNKFENIVGVLMRSIASVCLGIVFALFILNIATRLPFITYNPKWIDETIQFFLVWMIFRVRRSWSAPEAILWWIFSLTTFTVPLQGGFWR